ncbi:transient receptor potential cation channel protein painless-like [Anopheles gambiae]|uniref:transient receptor potential cation channel protein painless-like n=1 Tax=Anopheles gambiae TaxID=7165 RepID=UPI002AC9EC49|nr:transient receptor potential cation channel protein painless-like [Anopheles gambiae]
MVATDRFHFTNKSANDAERPFAQKDYTQFIQALENGADVNGRMRNSNYSIFELACKTPGSSKYIAACLKRGALATEENLETKLCPIHLAAQSHDCENLSELLNASGILVDQMYEDQTALQMLFKEIDGENHTKVFECIKLLLKHQANINVTDSESVSPIALLLIPGKDAWRKVILDYCLTNYNVYVDFRDGQARKAIEQHFPGTVIPPVAASSVMLDVLRDKLMAAPEEDFIMAYERYCEQNHGPMVDEKKCVELLSIALYRERQKAAEKLLEKQIVAGKFVGNLSLLSGMLAKCCNRGNITMLKWLLNIIPNDAVRHVNEDPLLSLLVKQIGREHKSCKDKGNCSFFRSMVILLNDPRIDVDKVDRLKCSALHYAAKYKIDHAQELLIGRGAYIGGEDLNGNLLMREMQKHLDSFVTSNDRWPGDEDFEVRINCANFIPPTQKLNGKRMLLYDEDEMRPIERLANCSKITAQLLWHPAIASILMLKWMRLISFLYINLLFACMFAVSFSIYIVFYYAQEATTLKLCLYLLSLFGWIYLTARELVQFFINTRVYVDSMENVMELVLIVGSATVLFFKESTNESWSIVLVGVLLLLGIELTLQIGAIPVNSIYTNMVMLKTVTKNFVQCLGFYSIILLSFTFSFYTLFRLREGTPLPGAVENENSTKADEVHHFNSFHEVPLALLKTAVMFTGEFEAADIRFNISWPMYLLFPLFVFFVTIVINNLMNGLAVSNTSAIQADSEVVGIIEMVHIICRHEKFLKVLNSFTLFQSLGPLGKWLFPNMQLFNYEEPLQEILLRPGCSYILECKKRLLDQPTTSNIENGVPKNESYSSIESIRKYSTNSLFNRVFKGMLDQIVNQSMWTVHLRQENVGSVEHRLEGVEQNLEMILNELRMLRESSKPQ